MGAIAPGTLTGQELQMSERTETPDSARIATRIASLMRQFLLCFTIFIAIRITQAVFWALAGAGLVGVLT